MTDVSFRRIFAMPNAATFLMAPIRDLLNEEVDPQLLWIDPFAKRRHEWARITNDLNPRANTDYHMLALDFLQAFADQSVDGVLFDPPYSPRQIKEVYDSIGLTLTQRDTQASFWAKPKDEIARILRPGGKAICFGWNTQGIGKARGFTLTRILDLHHGGAHNDTLCTVEIKTGTPTTKKVK